MFSAVIQLPAYTDPDYDPVIYKGTFFVLLEPAGPLEPDVYDEDEAIRQLLDEASFIFSAVIYGFSFQYTPQDNARGRAEEFEISPRHSIEWGDPSLSVAAGRYDDGRYDAEIRYRVKDEQLPWVRSWETGILPDISAYGEGRLELGLEGKKKAVEDSVKQAVRAYLRPRTYDKPRRISGYARIADVPKYSIDSGRFLCKARVTLQLNEVLEYETF